MLISVQEEGRADKLYMGKAILFEPELLTSFLVKIYMGENNPAVAMSSFVCIRIYLLCK